MVSGITIQEIKRATEHCGKPLPSLSQGYFTIINNCQVALFKYKNTEALTKQPNICVGFPYIMYGMLSPTLLWMKSGGGWTHTASKKD